MDAPHEFGGSWTEDKLDRLRGYLEAYMQILKFRRYKTVYVDAFAGTGSIYSKASNGKNASPADSDEDYVGQFIDGSAKVALSVQPPFDQYLFVEQAPGKAKQLAQLKAEFPALTGRIEIAQAEANDYLLKWIDTVNWRNTRAVVFMDPYGMQVEWRLLERIAKTHAIDLWLLVPIGMGANRLLTQSGLPPQEWQDRITIFFGSEEWKNRFYRAPKQPDLFGEGPTHEKAANYDQLEGYFVERMRTIFGNDGVAPRPLTQRNSRNSPMFMLCFASANTNGVKIANWLFMVAPRVKTFLGAALS